MIFRRRKTWSSGTQRLHDDLTESRQELQDVRRQAEERTPLLGSLQKHLQDNNFAERLIQSIDSSRRRTT